MGLKAKFKIHFCQDGSISFEPLNQQALTQIEEFFIKNGGRGRPFTLDILKNILP